MVNPDGLIGLEAEAGRPPNHSVADGKHDDFIDETGADVCGECPPARLRHLSVARPLESSEIPFNLWFLYAASLDPHGSNSVLANLLAHRPNFPFVAKIILDFLSSDLCLDEFKAASRFAL